MTSKTCADNFGTSSKCARSGFPPRIGREPLALRMMTACFAQSMRRGAKQALTSPPYRPRLSNPLTPHHIAHETRSGAGSLCREPVRSLSASSQYRDGNHADAGTPQVYAGKGHAAISASCREGYHTIEHSCPKLGALVFANSHPQNIFLSVEINPYGNVYRFLDDLSLAADVIVNRVKKYHCVDRLQRPLLLFFCCRQDLVGDTAYRRV